MSLKIILKTNFDNKGMADAGEDDDDDDEDDDDEEEEEESDEDEELGLDYLNKENLSVSIHIIDLPSDFIVTLLILKSYCNVTIIPQI